MEKVRFGLIGIGARGGAYAGFLTGRADSPACLPLNAPALRAGRLVRH